MKYCLDCGKPKSYKGNYCKVCGYKHRKNRPLGMKYKKHKENPTSFKKGQIPWNAGKSKPHLDKSEGYLKIYSERKEVKHHRLVMEKKLGRKLLATEDIHHIDNDKTNNDPSNLEILSRSDHIKLHWRTTRRQSG